MNLGYIGDLVRVVDPAGRWRVFAIGRTTVQRAAGIPSL